MEGIMANHEHGHDGHHDHSLHESIAERLEKVGYRVPDRDRTGVSPRYGGIKAEYYDAFGELVEAAHGARMKANDAMIFAFEVSCGARGAIVIVMHNEDGCKPKTRGPDDLFGRKV
jgi:hypothetical protein